jgi:hypothetical protein
MQNLADFGSAYNASSAMLAEAESDMISQHLPCFCLRRISYRTASSPLSTKILFFFYFLKMRRDLPFFWVLLANAFRVLSTSHVSCSLKYHQT